MSEKNTPVTEMIEDLDRSTERLDPEMINAMTEEIKEEVSLGQVDLFLKAISAVDSASLKGLITEKQKLLMTIRIEDLLRERMLPKGIEHFSRIYELLCNFSRLCDMTGIDASSRPDQYQELIDGKIKTPTYEQILGCKKFRHNRLILIPPWNRSFIADKLSDNFTLNINDLIPEFETPKQFYIMATSFDLSNYTLPTDSGSASMFVDREELEKKVDRWQKNFSDKTGMVAEGLSVREYLFFQLDYMRHINSGFDSFKNVGSKDSMEPCALLGEDKIIGNDYTTFGFSGSARLQIYIQQTRRDETIRQKQKTRLGIRFNEEEDA